MIRRYFIFIALASLVSCSGYFLNNNNHSIESQTEKLSLAMADGSGYLSTDQYNEITPFVFRDQNSGKTYLFYASDKDGSYDIYYAEMNSEGKFFAPVKMGPSINTSVSNEFSPVVFQSSASGSLKTYISFIMESNKISSIITYTLDNNLNFSGSTSAVPSGPYNPTHISLFKDSQGKIYLITADGLANYYRFIFNDSSGVVWNLDYGSDTAMSANSISGYMIKGAVFTNNIMVYDTVTNGKHQLRGEAFMQAGYKLFVPFEISAYSSSANDAYPFVDAEGGYKVYFASDRYGKGNYDLYRYNTKTFEAQVPSVLTKALNTVYVSPSGSDYNSGYIPESPLRTIQNAVNDAYYNGIHNVFLAEGSYTPGSGLNPSAPGLQINNFTNINIVGGYNSSFTVIYGKSSLNVQGNDMATIVYISYSTNISINNLIIENATNGRGIYIINSSGINVINNTVKGNGYAETDGGGLYIFYSSYVNLTGCDILLNSGYYGGGMKFENSDNNNVINCNILNNNSYYGGGLYYLNSVSNNISNCMINTNTALNDGGGLYINNDINDIFSSCNVLFNTAAGGGGGLFIINNSLTTNSCIIKFNIPDNVSNSST